MIVVQLSAIQDEPFASAFFSVRILDYDVKVFSPEILSDLRSGRRLGMPSTQPAIMVEAVPVSQWTWERPRWMLARSSVNWP